MIRAAIVGIGRWGRTLVSSVKGESKSICFTAGHTRSRTSAEAFCAEKGIALKDDLDAILADSEIDAVVLATPHSEHGAQAERAAAAGKHVFVEKPFTLDVKSAEAALDAVARAGVVLGVAYPRRYHPAMIELKARVQDGRLGVLSHCESAQTSPTGLFMPKEHWRAGPQEGPVGAMSATGVHNLDAMIYLFGRIDEVYCINLRRVMPRLEDTTSVLLGLANGMSASLFCSLITAVSYRFVVFGTKGWRSRHRMSNSASRRRRRPHRPAATRRPNPRSSNTRASMRSRPSSKALRRRSMASAHIRSLPKRCCTASPCSRRSCARLRSTSPSRLRLTSAVDLTKDSQGDSVVR
jgi:predicted dehydrogenase